MSCLFCLYSREPHNAVELKANDWIQNLLCHLFSASVSGLNEDSKAIEQLGCTSADYHGKLFKNTIKSLISRLRGSRFGESNADNALSADDVRALSISCIPIHTMPDVSPLIEALLEYHGSEPKEILDELFLDTINNSIMQKKIALSESAVLSLWLRHLPSLEKAILDLFQRLITIQSKSLQEMEQTIKDSYLPQASCHPAIFRIVDDIFRNALLESDGNIRVITIIRLFTYHFIQLYEKDNLQRRFPLRTYFPHSSPALLMALLRQSQGLPPNVCRQHLHGIVKKLQDVINDKRSNESVFQTWFLLVHFGDWVDMAAEQLLTSESEISDDLLWLLAFYYNPCNDKQERSKTMVEARELSERLVKLHAGASVCAGTLRELYEGCKDAKRNFCTMQLIRHLCIAFLLLSPEWHVIAKECISSMTQTQEAASEVSDVLARTVCRLNNTGMKKEKITDVAYELLHDV
ncbi:Fanconi anemia group C protein isoform X2 [Spea bombifrons]|nr:Fanconi anemia group C protein isoform X2 [Spea bombifrons]